MVTKLWPVTNIILYVWDLAFGVPVYVTWHLGCGTELISYNNHF